MKCEICDQEFPDDQKLAEHKQQVHGGTQQDDKPEMDNVPGTSGDQTDEKQPVEPGIQRTR